jgi:O-antigen/teichoic acid export membrane protein
MGESLRNQTVKGVIWSAIERFSVQGIQFVLGIILARLVAPSEYGLIALLGIFMAIAQTFIDSGFSNALIQKKDRTETDYSTVFYFNIIIACIIYGILFIVAPYIARFYKEPQLETITRLIGINLIVSSFAIVQRAKLTIKLDFKTQTKASLTAVIVSGLAGIFAAYHGYGVWALLIQSILSNILNTLLLWIFTQWKPLLVFSWESFKKLFLFGSKLLLSALLHSIYINLYSLVIGKKYSATDVGYYNRAYSFANFPSINIINIITKAVYPVQCQLQDDEKRLGATFHEYLCLSCYIIFPLMVGLTIVAKPLLLVLLTEKWLPAADLLSILCLAYMWYPVLAINHQILNVKGRTDYSLKAEIIKKVIAVVILILTLPYGLKVLCLGFLVYNISDMIIIIHYAKKVIKTSYVEQIKNIFPIFLLNIVMGTIVYFSIQLINILLLKLIIGIVIGVISYVGLSKIFHLRIFILVVSLVRRSIVIHHAVK